MDDPQRLYRRLIQLYLFSWTVKCVKAFGEQTFVIKQNVPKKVPLDDWNDANGPDGSKATSLGGIFINMFIHFLCFSFWVMLDFVSFFLNIGFWSLGQI